MLHSSHTDSFLNIFTSVCAFVLLLAILTFRPCSCVSTENILFSSTLSNFATMEYDQDQNWNSGSDEDTDHSDTVASEKEEDRNVTAIVNVDKNKNKNKITMNFIGFKLSEDTNDIKFLLFRNPKDVHDGEELLLDDMGSIDRSRFIPEQKTIFVIHGFWSNSTSGMPVTVKQGYMEDKVPHNIIVVDWGKLAAPEPKKKYYTAVAYLVIVTRNLPIVCRRIAAFIQFLVDKKYTALNKLHLIGHSLGAHISGGVGNIIQRNSKNNGNRLARITGLDPAGPGFQGIRIGRRIRGEDADFVDIYHSGAGTLGNIVYNLGDANFFPNGGHHQPGCVSFDHNALFFEAEFGSCSHSFISKIWAASVTKTFTACRCKPFFVDVVSGSACPGKCAETVIAGEHCPITAKGQYYFKTTDDPLQDDPPDMKSTMSDFVDLSLIPHKALSLYNAAMSKIVE